MSRFRLAPVLSFVLAVAVAGCGRSNLEPAASAPPPPAGQEHISGILFDPASVEVPTAGSAGLRLLGRARSGRVDLTGDPRVSFDVPAELVRYEGGRLTGLARGEGVVRARFQDLTAEVHVTVGREHSPTRLRIEPSTVRVAVGHVERFAILADRIEGNTDEVTDLPGTGVHLEGPAVVVIEGATLRGIAVGTALLVAERQGLRAEARVVVSRDDADLTRLTVTPVDAELGLDEGLQLVVTGHYPDGATESFTAEASGTSYTVDDPALLFAAGDGLFFADAPGATAIQVSSHGLQASVSVRIRPGGPRLTGIALVPERIRGPLFTTVALRVLGRRDDGSTIELGAAAGGTRYRSLDPEIAPVDLDGVVELAAPGLTGIEVEHGSFAAFVPVEVVLPPLAGFALVPDFDTITTGESSVLRAVATFAGGRTLDVSCESEYASTDPQVVAPGECGSLEGVIPGDEVVTATAPDGLSTAVARVSVRTRTLERLGMPCCFEVRVGDTFTVSALAYYSDGSTEDVAFDPETSWTISSPELLSGVPPTFTALAEGSTLILATYRGNELGIRQEIRAAAPDLIVRTGELLELETSREDLGTVVVEAGATLRLIGTREATLDARSIRIDGVLEALATPGIDGFTVAAPGGAGGPGGGGGGGAADGNSTVPAPGGGGNDPGGTAGVGAGAGTQAGAGGGLAGGLGAAGGCAQGGGGGASIGPGGAGGGDAGPGTGARGGFADPENVRGGSGGGGGSTCGDSSGGGGGGGGAWLSLQARTIEISGTIRADGARGGAGYTATGAGGGGSGGRVDLVARDRLVVTGSVSVRGAAGGGSADGDAGGGGGGGMIRLRGDVSLDVAGATLEVSGGAGGVATDGGFDGLAGGEGVVVRPDAG